MLEELTARRRQDLGPSHPLVTNTVAVLARVLDELGRPDEAISACLAQWEIDREIEVEIEAGEGGANAQAISNAKGLVELLELNGRVGEAASVHLELHAFERRAGLEGREARASQFNLACLLREAGRPEDALRQLRDLSKAEATDVRARDRRVTPT